LVESGYNSNEWGREDTSLGKGISVIDMDQKAEKKKKKKKGEKKKNMETRGSAL